MSQFCIALPHSSLAIEIHSSFKVLLFLSTKTHQTGIDTLHPGVPLDPASLRTCFLACQVPFCTNSHHHLPVLMKFPGHLAVSAIPVAGIQKICCLSASFS